MNGSEVLRVVDALHRDKNIDKEIVFEGIEQAILSAARKHFGEDYELEVDVELANGCILVLAMEARGDETAYSASITTTPSRSPRRLSRSRRYDEYPDAPMSRT